MKVWGVKISKGGPQRRWIVAAPTQKRAAELLGISVYELRTIGSQTGNEKEVEHALSNPETALLTQET